LRSWCGCQEVKLLSELGEEAGQKITELEALCKKLREDTQKLREEKTKLEWMVESRDELIIELSISMDTTAWMRMLTMRMRMRMMMMEEMPLHPLLMCHPCPCATCCCPEVIIVEEEDLIEMVLEQEVPEAHEVILADAEPELPQPWLYTMLMRDYEESPSRMMDDSHELDDPIEADYDVDEWFPEDGSNDRDWVIESSLKFRIKNKSLGVV
jgi:hypothetical protein